MKRKQKTPAERAWAKECKSLFTFGNKKLGTDTMIFNMTSATNCPSSVSGLCKVGPKCYALKAERTWPSVLPHREAQASFWDVCTAQNFIDVFNGAKTSGIKYLRINEAGDIRSQADITKLNLIAKELKVDGITTYLYTARSDLIFNNTEFVVNGSSWMADNEFRYIPKEALSVSLKQFAINRAVNQIIDPQYNQGVMVVCPGDCRDCNYCKVKGKTVIAVAEH